MPDRPRNAPGVTMVRMLSWERQAHARVARDALMRTRNRDYVRGLTDADVLALAAALGLKVG